MLQGAENYESIKNGFAPLIDEVNHVIEKGVIDIDNETYTLKFLMGGDYKVN